MNDVIVPVVSVWLDLSLLWRCPWFWQTHCNVCIVLCSDALQGANAPSATNPHNCSAMTLTLVLKHILWSCLRCWQTHCNVCIVLCSDATRGANALTATVLYYWLKINHIIFLLQRCEAVPGAERLMAPGVFLLSYVTLSMLTCIYINWFMTWPRSDCSCISLQYSSSVHVAKHTFPNWFITSQPTLTSQLTFI